MLISPRRVGKTGLIHHVFERIGKKEQGARCFYMDINATRNMSQFIQLLAKTVVGKVDSFSQAALRKITTFFANYRPTVSFDELTGIPTFSIAVAPDRQEESLKHIFEYLKQSANGFTLQLTSSSRLRNIRKRVPRHCCAPIFSFFQMSISYSPAAASTSCPKCFCLQSVRFTRARR